MDDFTSTDALGDSLFWPDAPLLLCSLMFSKGIIGARVDQENTMFSKGIIGARVDQENTLQDALWLHEMTPRGLRARSPGGRFLKDHPSKARGGRGQLVQKARKVLGGRWAPPYVFVGKLDLHPRTPGLRPWGNLEMITGTHTIYTHFDVVVAGGGRRVSNPAPLYMTWAESLGPGPYQLSLPAAETA